MKVATAQLKQIIQEELENTLDEFNYSAAAGAGLRAAQLSSGAAVAGSEEAELTLGGLISELRALLEEWEQKSLEIYTENFTDQIGIGVERVLFGITWIVQAALMLFVVALGLGMIFG